jgi:hypothetical protein
VVYAGFPAQDFITSRITTMTRLSINTVAAHAAELGLVLKKVSLGYTLLDGDKPAYSYRYLKDVDSKLIEMESQADAIAPLDTEILTAEDEYRNEFYGRKMLTTAQQAENARRTKAWGESWGIHTQQREEIFTNIKPNYTTFHDLYIDASFGEFCDAIESVGATEQDFIDEAYGDKPWCGLPEYDTTPMYWDNEFHTLAHLGISS